MFNVLLVLRTALLALGTRSLSVAQSAAALCGVLARASPQARFDLMEGSGRAVFVDQPEHFDRLLADFLAQTET